MVRTYVIVPLVILSLLTIVACAPKKEPAPEPVAQATVAQSESTATPTAAPAPEPTAEPTIAPAVDEAAEAEAQKLDWGANEDGCIIPGLVISGQLAGGIPCEPVTVGEGAAAEQAAGAGEMTGEVSEKAEEGTKDKPILQDANQPQDALAAEMTTLAVNDLSQQLGVPVDEIEVCDVCTVDWPDSSLGCPEPGMMYAQMVQPGHLIRLSVDGQTYFYHSGGMQTPFMCEETLQILPSSVDKQEKTAP